MCVVCGVMRSQDCKMKWMLAFLVGLFLVAVGMELGERDVINHPPKALKAKIIQEFVYKGG